MSGDRTKQPERDEFEFSLFGRGVGECVVLHLGDSRWIVVDSFRDSRSRRPVALDYLEALGVNVAKDVALVVATHWHDDHMRGIADVVRTAESALFSCSIALNTDEFFTLLDAAGRIPRAPAGYSTGVDELREVVTLLAAGPRRRGPDWALEGRTLLRVVHQWDGGAVASLSPSPGTVTATFHEIANLIPRVGLMRRFATSEPNDRAVVLWVQAGKRVALLGADLEDTSDPVFGWAGVLAAPSLPTGPAEMIKVAHHGSLNGDHPGVWIRLLTSAPLAALTPYLRGATPLPRVTDTQRLRQNTPNLYMAGARSQPLPRRVVDKSLKSIVRNRRVLAGATGHVRFRGSLAGSGPARIETFGAVTKL